ncbi:MAG: hypothetical protein AAF125_00765 [Chloroflexota bacterium]
MSEANRIRAEAIRRLARKKLAEQNTNIAEQAGSGVNEGLADVVGMPVDLVTAGINAGVRGVNSLAGTEIGQIENPVGGSESIRGLLEPFISPAEPQTSAQDFARRVGYETGATVPFLGLNPAGSMAAKAGTLGAANVGAAGAGQAAAALAPDNQLVEDLARLGGGLAGGGLGSALAGSVSRGRAAREFVNSTPATDDLSAAAKAKYQEGHALNLKIKPNATQQFDAKIRQIAEGEGLITPSGKVADMPDLKQALALLEDYQKAPTTTRQFQALRRRFSDMAGSADPNTSRVGVALKREYDNFLGQFAPQFKEANALNARAYRGEMMDRAEELADIRASQYSQSGHENALRTEFRQMDRDIAKGRSRGLRPDQVQAVQDVSRGTRATNAARQVGKLAPKGAISLGQHAIPFAIGSYLGGPAVGALAAGTTASTGVAGQALASLLQSQAAQRASAAMRSATPLNLPGRLQGQAGIAAMLSGQAATSGRR